MLLGCNGAGRTAAAGAPRSRGAGGGRVVLRGATRVPPVARLRGGGTWSACQRLGGPVHGRAGRAEDSGARGEPVDVRVRQGRGAGVPGDGAACTSRARPSRPTRWRRSGFTSKGARPSARARARPWAAITAMGKLGEPKPRRAARWFKRGCKDGDPGGCHELALAHLSGKGVTVEPRSANRVADRGLRRRARPLVHTARRALRRGRGRRQEPGGGRGHTVTRRAPPGTEPYARGSAGISSSTGTPRRPRVSSGSAAATPTRRAAR